MILVESDKIPAGLVNLVQTIGAQIDEGDQPAQIGSKALLEGRFGFLDINYLTDEEGNPRGIQARALKLIRHTGEYVTWGDLRSGPDIMKELYLPHPSVHPDVDSIGEELGLSANTVQHLIWENRPSGWDNFVHRQRRIQGS
jgi:hypothetical protein